MENMNCNKYPFDYWKHIVVKRSITPQYRLFTEKDDLFLGVELNRCDNCMIEGFSDIGIPFHFLDINTEELRCTLLRMGLKPLDYDEIEFLPFISESHNSQYFCDSCHDMFETLEYDEDLSED